MNRVFALLLAIAVAFGTAQAGNGQWGEFVFGAILSPQELDSRFDEMEAAANEAFCTDDSLSNYCRPVRYSDQLIGEAGWLYGAPVASDINADFDALLNYIAWKAWPLSHPIGRRYVFYPEDTLSSVLLKAEFDNMWFIIKGLSKAEGK